MDPETTRRLLAINRRFYAARAAEFARTRGAAWPGWRRLLPALRGLARDAARGGRALRVLDAGCGNARFARFLAAELAAAGPDAGAAVDYLGVDASAELLRAARGAGAGLRGFALLRADFARAPDALAGLRGRFDAALLFGVLHHVPGAPLRRALLARLCAALRAGGLLALSAWQLHGDPRFAGRRLSWEAYNRGAAEPIDLAQLEPGDALLAFGSAQELPRYCHFGDESGIRALFEGLPLAPGEGFRADGRSGELNRYYLLRRLPMQEP